jgi:hypothetical protein
MSENLEKLLSICLENIKLNMINKQPIDGYIEVLKIIDKESKGK